jgi:glutathione S-transferase
MLELYHSNTSVCAIKARITLHEKGIDWVSRKIDLTKGDQHTPEYLKLNPNAVVPTLVHDGRVVIESTLIIEYLDDAFPEPALMPTDAYGRAQARHWMKKIDDYLHAACSTVSFAIAFRNGMLQMPKEAIAARLAKIPDPAYRERQRLSIEFGLDAPHVAQAVRNYDKYIGEMEKTLSERPYLAGDRYSLADVAPTSYINRAEMLAMDELWVGRRPHVQDWFARMRARPSFEPAITAHLSDFDRSRFQFDRDAVRQKIKAMLAN